MPPAARARGERSAAGAVARRAQVVGGRCVNEGPGRFGRDGCGGVAQWDALVRGLRGGGNHVGAWIPRLAHGPAMVRGKGKEMADALTKAEMLALIGERHAEIEAVLAHLSESEMLQTGVMKNWSAKDILVHITMWEQWLLRVLRGDAGAV